MGQWFILILLQIINIYLQILNIYLCASFKDVLILINHKSQYTYKIHIDSPGTHILSTLIINNSQELNIYSYNKMDINKKKTIMITLNSSNQILQHFDQAQVKEDNSHMLDTKSTFQTSISFLSPANKEQERLSNRDNHEFLNKVKKIKKIPKFQTTNEQYARKMLAAKSNIISKSQVILFEKHFQFSKIQSFRKITKDRKKKQFRALPLTQILDWSMQAASLAQISKDSFYRAAIIITFVYEQIETKSILRCRQWEPLCLAALSLAWKTESSQRNISQILEKIVPESSRLQINQYELQIFRQLRFRIPRNVFFYEQAIAFCKVWNQFLIAHPDLNDFARSNLQLSQSQQKVQQVSPGSDYSGKQNRFTNFLHMTDFIILNNPIRFLLPLLDKHDNSNDQQEATNYKVRNFQIPFTYALSVVIDYFSGYKLRQQIQKYGHSIFDDFLKKGMKWESEEIMLWRFQMKQIVQAQDCYTQIAQASSNFILKKNTACKTDVQQETQSCKLGPKVDKQIQNYFYTNRHVKKQIKNSQTAEFKKLSQQSSEFIGQ